MSLVLRHKPEELGLTLDQHGWVKVSHLITGLTKRYPDFTMDILEEVVRSNDKKRFEYDDSHTLIRACQGHSVTVDLALTAVEPPEILYHGTTIAAWRLIQESGIQKQGRHAVHLSEDRKTAFNVGNRHGIPVVIEIRARQMHEDGREFFRSGNGVWLTGIVPPNYIIRGLYPHEL